MIKYLPPKDNSFGEFLERLYPEKYPQKVQGITIQVTEDCCMACTYCYQNHKTNNKMNFETAKKFIDDLLSDSYEVINSKNMFAVSLDFIGGEPLMEIDLIEQIWIYYYTKLIELNHPWLYHARFDICTNGLLYNTPKVQEFIKKYANFISLTISIDGNKELHDSCRLDLQGQGTYDRAISAVRHYKNNYHIMPETKMTLAPSNIQYLSTAIFNLINEGYYLLHLNCIFEPGWTTGHARIMYDELKKVADYLLDNDLYNKINVFLFNEGTFCRMDEDDNNNWCGGVSDTGLAINPTGNLYPCLRYMESSLNNKREPIIFGDIYNGYKATELHKQNYEKINNITRRSQSTDKCFYCPIAKGCSWCSAYNYEETGSANIRVTHICCMHQATSLANVYYWNKLYQKLNIDKRFIMHIPKDWALKIIDEKEYNYLYNISKGG